MTAEPGANPRAGRLTGSRSVALSAVARAAGFVPTALALLLTSRVIISHYGVAVFDSFSLMLALILILPLNSLGVGAAVTSAFAESGATSERAQRVSLTAARTLTVSTLGLTVMTVALAGAEIWPKLIGDAAGPNAFISLGVIIYAASFVPGLAPSMLLGANRNHVTVAVQSFFAPVTFLWVLVAVVTGLDGRWVILASPAAALTIQLMTAVIARSTGVRWSVLLRRIPNRRKYPGGQIRQVSGPMFLATLAVPIALQSDRIVLSHVSSLQTVANYSVAFQIFAPVAALVTAAAQPLWPLYVQARAEGRSGPNLVKITILFVSGAALACAVLVAVANPVGRLIGGSQMQLGILLPVSASLMVMVQALVTPLAMTLVDPAGLRAVAAANLAALPLNLALSVILAQHLGAAGPLLATAIVIVCVQAAPLSLYARNRASSGRHRRPRGAEPHPVLLLAMSDTPAIFD